MLNRQSYVWKFILGSEIAYLICLLSAFIPMSNKAALELHHLLFETLPGFVWLDFSSFLLGAFYTLVFAWLFGQYYVWMHNSSIQ